LSVDINHLSFTYTGASSKALDDISLSIPRGAFIGLVGPSGCGKTTLARCLNGLIPHFHSGQLIGRVVVDGWDTQDHPAFEMAQKVGLVFQNPENQLVAPTVEREIGFGPENLGVPRTEIRHRVEQLLQQIHLEALRDKAPYELSGGEQQQVAIAAILALQPQVLVLDEPTSNLDPVSAQELLVLLNQLNQELGLTILLIEHRLELMLPFLHELVVLDQGRILIQGAPAQVFSHPRVAEIGVSIPKIVQLAQQIQHPRLRTLYPLAVEDIVRAILQEVPK
jgi:energy-coupling factor transporter ATP-binding protein EcfA2